MPAHIQPAHKWHNPVVYSLANTSAVLSSCLKTRQKKSAETWTLKHKQINPDNGNRKKQTQSQVSGLKYCYCFFVFFLGAV